VEEEGEGEGEKKVVEIIPKGRTALSDRLTEIQQEASL